MARSRVAPLSFVSVRSAQVSNVAANGILVRKRLRLFPPTPFGLLALVHALSRPAVPYRNPRIDRRCDRSKLIDYSCRTPPPRV